MTLPDNLYCIKVWKRDILWFAIGVPGAAVLMQESIGDASGSLYLQRMDVSE